MSAPEARPAEAASADTRTHVSRREFFEIFTAVMLPMFMAMADQTLLATATPMVAAEFGNLHQTSWIATAYLLTGAVMVPVYGRLGDRHGRREILMTALGIFMIGSAVSAASTSMNMLIAGRALQGLGGGGLMSLSFSLVGELVPPRQRVSFQGYFAIISTAANVLGPIIGGQVVAYASWRWLLIAQLPLGAVAAWRLARVPRGQRNPDAPGVADLVGLMLFALGTTALLFVLSSAGHRFAWLSWQSAVCVATGTAAWIVLLLHEHQHEAPFLPIELLRIRAFRQSLVTATCSTFCLLSMVFYLPVYYQLGMQRGAAQAGLLLAPVLLGFVVGGALGGRYAGKTGNPKPVPVVGLTLSAAALLALVVAPPERTVMAVIGFVAGLGLGPTMPTVQVVVQTLAGRDKLGAATAMASFSRALGAALGTAVIGAIFYGLMPDVDVSTLVRSGHGVVVGDTAQIVHAFRVAFGASAVVAVLGAFNASRVPRVHL